MQRVHFADTSMKCFVLSIIRDILRSIEKNPNSMILMVLWLIVPVSECFDIWLFSQNGQLLKLPQFYNLCRIYNIIIVCQSDGYICEEEYTKLTPETTTQDVSIQIHNKSIIHRYSRYYWEHVCCVPTDARDTVGRETCSLCWVTFRNSILLQLHRLHAAVLTGPGRGWAGLVVGCSPPSPAQPSPRSAARPGGAVCWPALLPASSVLST